MKPDFNPSSRASYPRVRICGLKSRIAVHRLVAMAFIGECPQGHEVNHKDGNKANARPENLEYVTRSQNEKHKFAVLGYAPNRGQRHGRSKLTDSQVEEIIKRSAETGFYQRTGQRTALAAEFGVSIATISEIANGNTWRHLSRLH